MPEMKRTVKDSVFTCLFSDPKYARELYLYLHPEDPDVTEADCRLVTIENIFSDAQRGLYGLSKQAIQETIRICLERGILTPFLTAKREEVVDLMEMLFSQEEIWRLDTEYYMAEGEKRGEKRG